MTTASDEAIGFTIVLLSTLVSTVGKHLWRLAGIAIAPEPLCPMHRKGCLAYTLYLVGFLALCLEGIFNAVALEFASANLVASCQGLAFVWNTLLAPCWLNERLTVVRLGAAATIVVGTVMVGLGQPPEVAYSGDEYVAFLLEPKAVAYYCIEAVGVTLCFAMWYQCKSMHAAAIGAGWLAGNQFLEKAFMELLDGSTAFWVLLSTFSFLVIASAVVLAAALRGAEALDIVATFLAIQITTGAVSGALVLNEMQGASGGTLALFIIGLVTITAAFLMLVRRSALPCPDREIESACCDRLTQPCRQCTDTLVGGKLLDEEAKLAPAENTVLLDTKGQGRVT